MAREKLAPRWELFWSKVDLTGGVFACWPWSGGRTTAGYGEFKVGGRDEYAHRLAYEFYLNAPVDKWVLHRCDNPPCCNPLHLYEGSHADNMRDVWSRGRSNFQKHPEQRGLWRKGAALNQHGEQSPKAKLTAKDVRVIRDLHRSGVTQRWIAGFSGVGTSQTNRIIKRSTWIAVE